MAFLLGAFCGMEELKAGMGEIEPNRFCRLWVHERELAAHFTEGSRQDTASTQFGHYRKPTLRCPIPISYITRRRETLIYETHLMKPKEDLGAEMRSLSKSTVQIDATPSISFCHTRTSCKPNPRQTQRTNNRSEKQNLHKVRGNSNDAGYTGQRWAAKQNAKTG